jgi:ABC-2 type transport system permease protein
MNTAKYLAVFKNNWQYHLEYRVDTLLRILIGCITLISAYYVWNDVYATRSLVGSYTRSQMITYYVLVSYFYAVYVYVPISEEIQDGSLSGYLIKPINYLIYHYWFSMSKRLFRLLIGLPVIALIYVLFNDQLYLASDPRSYLVLAVCLVGAINIYFITDVIISLWEFWWQNAFGSIALIYSTLVAFFSGSFIPLSLLPNSMQIVASCLPFKYTIFFIVDSFINYTNWKNIFLGIGFQCFWTVALCYIAVIIWKKGLIKYEAFGG